MLGNFQHQPRTLVVSFKRVENLRQVSVKLDVDNSADDLSDTARGLISGICHVISSLVLRLQSASAPEIISISSLVMTA